ERIYECHYVGCTLRTNSSKEYREHRKTHGKPFIYECKEPNCRKQYNHRGSFHSHKKRNHQPHQLKSQCEC
ncbi:hypothetical protein LOAG_19141, partial [Loa loa]